MSEPIDRTPEHSIPVGHGFTYRERATGKTWTLIGRRSGRRVGLSHGRGTMSQQLRDFVPVAVLEADYEFLDCNHTDYCCSIHDTHTSPHRGCILR